MVQHQDTIADAHYQLHLVLDQDDRPFARELHDQIHHDAGFLRAHAGGRLVKQQQSRPARERHRDFERTLLAMRQRLAVRPRASDSPTRASSSSACSINS